jgi:hypothetical protein
LKYKATYKRTEDLSVPGCNNVSLDEYFLMFPKDNSASTSGSSSLRSVSYLSPLDPEDDGSRLFEMSVTFTSQNCVTF